MDNYPNTQNQGTNYIHTTYFKESVDWNKLFCFLKTLQSDKFNEKTMRFVKSDMISKSFEQCSNHKFRYVDDNGCDFLVQEKNLRVELKSGGCIFPKRINYTRTIRVYNSRGTPPAVLPNNFDYLLMVEPGMAGIISYEKLLPYTIGVADGINARIDMKDVDVIIRTDNVKTAEIDLSVLYNTMMYNAINQFNINYEKL